jgi:hypothetical protein
LKDNEYENAVLSGLAVLGTCGKKNGWVPAIFYTPTLAAMIISMRAIIIRRAWRKRMDYMEQQVSNGVDHDVAERDAPVIHQLVQQDVAKFMTMTEYGGKPHPIQTIHTQRMYGLKIRWRAEDMPRFDMASIVDNHSIMDEGYSFAHDARNPWPVEGKRWLGQRLFTEAHVRARFMEDSETKAFNPDAVESYLRQVKRWKEEMSCWCICRQEHRREPPSWSASSR